MKLVDEMLEQLKVYEGLKLKSYLCPAGVWTIGYGTTVYPPKEPGAKRIKVKKGESCTLTQALEYFLYDVNEFADTVRKRITRPLSDNQFSALVSFAYNVGGGNFQRSTLLKKTNAGDIAGAGAEFAKWNKGGGKVLKGLTLRRAKEKALFLKA